LPSTGLAGAVLAAVHQAHRFYGGRARGARATEAVLADDSARGHYAGRNCGPRLQHRTVVVYLRFPALAPSASLSEGVVLVSRFRGGYRVWARLH
jgi:hypothetical protein